MSETLQRRSVPEMVDYVVRQVIGLENPEMLGKFSAPVMVRGLLEMLVQAEREECAKVAEDRGSHAGNEIAEQILARGKA